MAAPADKPFARAHYEIHSARLTIRTPTEADAEAFHALLINPANNPYGSGVAPKLTVDQVKDRIERFSKMAAEGKNAFMVIVQRDTGVLVGHGGYNTFEYVNKDEFLGKASEGAEGSEGSDKVLMTDLGLLFDHRYWRRGYGRELIDRLVEYGHAELGVELFRTETDLDNEPWRALMRACGVGAAEQEAAVSFDPSARCLAWKFDVEQYSKALAGRKAKA